MQSSGTGTAGAWRRAAAVLAGIAGVGTLLLLLALVPPSRRSGRELRSPPAPTPASTEPAITGVSLADPDELATVTGELLDARLELVVADSLGVRVVDLSTGGQAQVDPSPDVRSIEPLDDLLVVVADGRARLIDEGVGGPGTDVGPTERLLRSAEPGRVWLIDGNVATEIDRTGLPTRGPYPLPAGFTPRAATRLWLVGDGDDGLLGISTDDGRTELLAPGRLLVARDDTLVWVDCGEVTPDDCQLVIESLASGALARPDLPVRVDLGTGTISPGAERLALTGFDDQDLPVLVLVDLLGIDAPEVIPTETQPDWFDLSEPWSADGRWLLWRGFAEAETLWALELGDELPREVGFALRGEVNDAIVR